MTYLVLSILQPQNQSLPDLDGINGKPVRYFLSSGLAAAYCEMEGRINPRVEDVLKFEEITETLYSVFPLIPLRFGNYFESLGKLENFLRKNADRLTRVIEKLAGKVEMGIRVLSSERIAREKPQAEIRHARSGRQYLAGRKSYYASQSRHTEKTEKLAGVFKTTFRGLFFEMKVEEQGTPALSDRTTASVLISAYFLISNASVAEFRTKFAELAFDDADFLLSGPWPPYNFTDLQSAKVTDSFQDSFSPEID